MCKRRATVVARRRHLLWRPNAPSMAMTENQVLTAAHRERGDLNLAPPVATVEAAGTRAIATNSAAVSHYRGNACG
jgi:hypothetical protein